MEYKIIGALIHNRKTVGYMASDANGSIIKIEISMAIELAKRGRLCNATYNKNKNSLSGANGTDLRAIPKHKLQSNMPSNHELVDRYNAKLKMLGFNGFAYEKIPGDRVRLVQVLDTDRTGVFEIPSFISDFASYPLEGCNFTDIIVHNNPLEYIDARGLCAHMNSNSIKLKFDYPERVVMLDRLFYGSHTAQSIHLEDKDFKSLKSMGSMYEDCYSVRSIDLSNMNSCNVQDMRNLFKHCMALEKLNLSEFKTNSTRYMGSMFYYCISLQSINLSSFNTSTVVDMFSTFACCDSLKTLDISNFTASSYVDIREIFRGCSNLMGIDMSKFRLLAGIVEGAFIGCESMRQLKSCSKLIADEYKRSKEIRY